MFDAERGRILMNLLLMRPIFMIVCLMSLVLGAMACSGGDSDGAAPAAPVVPTKQPVAGKMGNITSPALQHRPRWNRRKLLR